MTSGSFQEQIEAMNTINETKHTISPTTVELASSLNTFTYFISYVPDKHDYMHGSFFIRNILSAIPFSSRLTSKFLNPEKQYQSSDSFVTYIIQGQDYTYGNATSINADLYLNFGVLGVVFGLFILGFFFKYVEYNVFMAKTPSISMILLIVYLAGFSLIWNRYGFLTPINYFVFSYILNRLFADAIILSSKL